MMTHAELKHFLDNKADQYNSKSFIENDPLAVPHQFSKKEDIEISGFLAATIAWGRRQTILDNARKLTSMMDKAPHQFIMAFSDQDLKPFRKFTHRTFNGTDCEYFLWSLKNIYQKHKGLEAAFQYFYDKGHKDIRTAITGFRELFFELEHHQRTEKHLANPAKKSSAKRLNMFLRWMVRSDDRGVDFGLWKSISPASLICPLDIHSGTVARKLGLLQRKQNDWQAAEELTNALKRFDPLDPVKYDFALFSLGIAEGIK